MHIFRFFAVVWGFAELIHIAAFAHQSHGLTAALLGIAAILLVFKPAPATLLAVAVLDVIHVVAESPYTANHILYNGLVNLSIAIAIAAALRTRHSGGQRSVEQTSFATFAPLLRIELVILYLLAVLHKLNWDFLDPDVSCGTFLMAGVNRRLGLPEPTGILAEGAIWITLVLETAIPLLLVFRKTRTAGLVTGAIFHLILALHPNPGIFSFSAFIYALYLVFVPTDRLSEALKRFENSDWWDRGPILKTAGLVVLLIAASFELTWFAWLGLSSVYFAVVAVALRSKADAQAGPATDWRRVALVGALPVVMILLNSLAPYLGLQTTRTLAMFSNLRTEGGQTNHLFIHYGAQVFGFQRDLVEIVSSPHEHFRELGDSGELLPYVEFYRHVELTNPASVEFVRGGMTMNAESTADSRAAETLERPNWIALRFSGFRAVDKEGPSKCRW